MSHRIAAGALLAALSLLAGCATLRTLNANRPDVPLVYSGTRLDWYAIHGGCCPLDHFGAEPPPHPALDLPGSVLLDTLFLPFTLAAELGVALNVSGGL
ncbi:YceK/YidQ family lipoprotein [Azorhizophilus paspali]|uniref:YceK/YidQ family lipoprotein n=1 Tax=Azorhizophilus paspali TaxID=69963 RepID=A0ABV6SKT2_AZOPA